MNFVNGTLDGGCSIMLLMMSNVIKYQFNQHREPKQNYPQLTKDLIVFLVYQMWGADRDRAEAGTKEVSES